MVSFRVRRLPDEDPAVRRYHLFDRAEQLLLVADQGSGWLSPGPPQVRFGRPDGERVATMELPRPDERRADRKQNYAVIYEHAVYALITAMDLSSGTSPINPPPLPVGPRPFDRLLIEVEGNRWLGLCWTGEETGPLLVLYDAEAAGLSPTIDPEAVDLPEPIGLVEAAGEHEFALTLPAGRPAQGALLGLALIYLIDNGS